MIFLKSLNIFVIEMHIRKAFIDDLDDIMEIYRIAQDFMIESEIRTSGNTDIPLRI